MAKLVLLRHGESEWNLENRFTGWTDIDLSQKGIEEAKQAGETLLKQSFEFDKAYTSALIRAQKTLDIVLEILKQQDVPIIKDKALNERHYGTLQGLNKNDMKNKVGEEQVLLWRRSYDVRPPGGESLKDTAERVLPFFKENILKDVSAGKDILVSAHGNSLRAIVMYFDKLNEKEVMDLNICTGCYLCYEINDKCEIVSKQFIGQN